MVWLALTPISPLLRVSSQLLFSRREAERSQTSSYLNNRHSYRQNVMNIYLANADLPISNIVIVLESLCDALLFFGQQVHFLSIDLEISSVNIGCDDKAKIEARRIKAGMEARRIKAGIKQEEQRQESNKKIKSGKNTISFALRTR